MLPRIAVCILFFYASSSFSLCLAYAQETGNMSVGVTITPTPIGISITSSSISFGELHGNAGQVSIDPVTGEMSTESSSPFSMGEITLAGKAGDRYTLSITTASLQPADDATSTINYRPLLAKADNCEEPVFAATPTTAIAEGTLSDAGCSRIRVGGTLGVQNVSPDRYRGTIFVSILR